MCLCIVLQKVQLYFCFCYYPSKEQLNNHKKVEKKKERDRGRATNIILNQYKMDLIKKNLMYIVYYYLLPLESEFNNNKGDVS